MDESNFRFYNFGQGSNQSNGLFYNEVFLLMNYRRLNPTRTILISIENDNDLVANSFWSDNRVVQFLINSGCKALRIKSQTQQTEYQQFDELYHVSSIPSLFVFGPNSNAPSFVYTPTYPSYEKLVSDFSTLSISTASMFQMPNSQYQPVQPQQNVPSSPYQTTPPLNHDLYDDPFEKALARQRAGASNQHSKPSSPPRISKLSNPTQKPPTTTQKPAPQVAEKKLDDQNPIEIEVTATTPDKQQHTQIFNSKDNCLTIRTWISKIIKKPHTEYNLRVVDGDYLLPLSDKISLAKYAPKLQLNVELTNQPKQPKKTSALFATISNFFSYISPFADPNGDPADFWRVTPNTQPGPNQ